MMKKLLLVGMFAASFTAQAEWEFRGTPNDWKTTPLTHVQGTEYQTCQTFGSDNPRFKIDRWGNWQESYPQDDISVVANTSYQITFYSDSKHIERVEVADCEGEPDGWPSLYFRGTPNDWDITPFVEQTEGVWQVEVDFDGRQDQRFKLDVYGDWSLNYGSSDSSDPIMLVQSGGDIYTQVIGRYSIEVNENSNTLSINGDPNMAPHAVITPEGPLEVELGDSIIFDGSDSWDEDGQIASYAWSNRETTETAQFTFNELGEQSISLTVVDDGGAKGTASVTVNVTGDPESDWCFRGTPNGWTKTVMPYNPDTGLFELLQPFNGEEDPARFKVARCSTDWQESYPTQDFPVTDGEKFLISFDETAKQVDAELVVGPSAPELTVSPQSKTFTSDNLSVTLSYKGEATDATYLLSDSTGDAVAFENGDVIVVGADLEIGQSVDLYVEVANDVGSDSATYTYTKGDPEEIGFTVWLKAPSGWDAKIHHWDAIPEGSWPDTDWSGDDMKELGEDWFRYKFPNSSSSKMIFNNNGASQTDTLTRSSDGCYYYADNRWTDSCDVPPVPVEVGISGAKLKFWQASILVTLEADGDDVTGGRYTLDGSDPMAGTPYNTGDQIPLGEGLEIGDTVELRLWASNDVSTASERYTFEKIEKPSASSFSWDNATVYFVLTDRFLNADTSNDHSYGREKDRNGSPYAGYENRVGAFQGGDLKGLTQKLKEDYFNDLGITAIWLTSPIEQIHGFVGGTNFKYYGNHGYWMLDPTAVDANMGTEADLLEFVDTAHEKGIRVVLDVVINHVGYDNLIDASQQPYGALNAGWEDYYYTSDPSTIHYETYGNYFNYSDGAWSQFWGRDWIRHTKATGYDICAEAYGAFDCGGGLPDVKLESNATVSLPPLLQNKWAKEGRLSQEQAELDAFFNNTGYPRTVGNHFIKWITDWVREYGFDGIRMDTVKNMEGQGEEVLKRLKDQSVIALNEWRAANPNKLPDEQELDFWMTGEYFDHGVGRSHWFDFGFDSMINFNFAGVSLGSIEGVYSSYAASINTDPTFNVLSYISSHDKNMYSRSNLIDGGSALLMAPGAVQIYYGDETARPLVDAPFGDLTLRSFMNWSSIDQNVHSHWQRLGQFRARHVAVGAGSHTQLSASPYTFKREKDGDAVIVVFGASGNVTVDVSSVFGDCWEVTEFYNNNKATVANGKVTFPTSNNGVLLLEGVEKTCS
ncbi:hypothetical protein DU002_03075 [Corallincola holothuriorum]|uniref:Alpha-amylase n=2 Tax=Corallincola holothuriorum TaxID=2282215 RepID=A0A368NLJ8_9GAMM|nr:hypothetical protein DU002_03075 [Corallincola holothuriorum]